ncbi:MAG: UxaA family hydrolase, partial [Clostridia bacterium]|nr:UxaA family hydrolase [Clostridia bacterium]
MERRFILSDPKDNVVTLLENASAGDVIELQDAEIVLLQDIPFAHKAALSDIPKGAGVFKYGERLGYALCDIKKGEWIHVHNLGCDTLEKGS